MKILISGGHLTPALAFIDYVQKQDKEVDFVFAGRKFQQTKNKQPAREKRLVEKRGVTFVSLDSGKLSGNIFNKLKNGLKVIKGSLQSILIVAKQQPDVFVSFGGYLAVPLAIACWLWRVPIITHEQTRAAGVANIFIARFAKKVALSHPQSEKYFPKKKTTVTGNIIRQSIFQKSPEKPDWFETRSKKPVLLITGGSQGSEILNSTISQIIQPLLRSWVVIHACGPSSEKRNYKQELERLRSQLPLTHQSRYMIREWITEDELAWIYPNTDLTIARSGANSSQEIAMYNIPSIFIPLPFSHKQEQLLNAQAIANSGGSVIMTQKELNPQTLLATVKEIEPKLKSMRKKMKKVKFVEDGAKNLYHTLKHL